MKNGFTTSGYSESTIDSIILPILYNAESGLNKNTQIDKNKKENHDTFTRVTTSNVKRVGVKANVVIKSGRKLKSLLPKNKPIPCTCYYCKIGGFQE